MGGLGLCSLLEASASWRGYPIAPIRSPVLLLCASSLATSINFYLDIAQVYQNQTHHFPPTWLALLSLDATPMKGNPGPTRETWKPFLTPPHAAPTSQGLPHSEVTPSYPHT